MQSGEDLTKHKVCDEAKRYANEHGKFRHSRREGKTLRTGFADSIRGAEEGAFTAFIGPRALRAMAPSLPAADGRVAHAEQDSRQRQHFPCSECKGSAIAVEV